MREAFQTLLERLAGRGWSEGQIGDFVGGNYLRLLGEVLPASRPA
jgi:microsomal dipeptidase-like Zn-dependent dipeptidase